VGVKVPETFLRCHSFTTSKQSEIPIPVPASPVPSSPLTFRAYMSAFFAQPYVLPAAIPAT